jgi:hypothetical protein
MPTFDIVSKIDGQTLDNAINTAKKRSSTVTISTIPKAQLNSIKNPMKSLS